MYFIVKQQYLKISNIINNYVIKNEILSTVKKCLFYCVFNNNWKRKLDDVTFEYIK